MLLLFCFSFAHASEPKVLFSSTTVLPGDTLRIERDAVTPDIKTQVLFRGRSYTAFPVGPNTQRALIGIPLGMKPGRYSLFFRSASHRLPPGPKTKPFWIEVAPRTYGVENVSFTPDKLSLMRLDHVESQRIHTILKNVNADQYWEGVFNLPVNGKRVGEFGVRRVANGHLDRGFHKGYDLETAAGTPIQAANSGVVLLAYPFKMHGRTVILDHGQGVMTIYLHMKSYAVAPGQKVTRGQIIGAVGSTGLSTAPHVHWGVYVHSVPVDPKPWLETEF